MGVRSFDLTTNDSEAEKELRQLGVSPRGYRGIFRAVGSAPQTPPFWTLNGNRPRQPLTCAGHLGAGVTELLWHMALVAARQLDEKAATVWNGVLEGCRGTGLQAVF